MNVQLGAFPVADGGGVPPAKKFVPVEQLVARLGCPELRYSALKELSTRRNEVIEIAPLLWHSFATIATLVQEVVSVCRKLSPPTLSMVEANRAGYALVLLQCVAAHSDTRMLFVKANIAYYLHPFLSSVDKTKPLEYLRVTALGVIGTLIKPSEPEVIQYLIGTELLPECLRSMAIGDDLSKTVATFIVQKILSDDSGLNYICATADRFFAVGSALAQMVTSVAERPSLLLLKKIIRCYLYLTNNSRARDALWLCLPDTLKDGTFHAYMEEDPTMTSCLLELLSIVGVNQGSQPQQGLRFEHTSQVNFEEMFPDQRMPNTDRSPVNSYPKH